VSIFKEQNFTQGKPHNKEAEFTHLSVLGSSPVSE
jgi:hypothetical protein